MHGYETKILVVWLECLIWSFDVLGIDMVQERSHESAIGLVVKYLVAIEMPRVRFPDGATFFLFILVTCMDMKRSR